MSELFEENKDTQPMIAVIGRITVTTVMYNGSVLQRQGATLWYRLNPTANAWEALANHGEIEQHYQKELRNTDGKGK